MPLRPLSGGRPIRAPSPYDIKINGLGYMMFGGSASKGGPPVPTIQFEHPDPLSAAAPTEFAYSAQNPLIEATSVYESFVAGFGQQRQQHRDGEKRYRVAVGMDCSIDGQAIMGPQINTVTPATVDATNGSTSFFEIGGVLYLLQGRYVLVRTMAETITISGFPTGGTYTVTYSGNTSGAIAFNALAATVQTALRLVPGLGSVTVTRTGDGATTNFVYTVLMVGAGVSPATFTTTDSLTGGSASHTTVGTTETSAWWTVSQDFGANKAGLDVVVHKQNGGSTTYAYVAMGDTEPVWKFNGTAWTQSIEALYARAFAIVGRELYRGTAVNQLSKVDSNADPFVLANWSADNSFYVGDNARGITRLMVDSSGTLIVAKTDGIYILDRDGNDIQLTSDLKLVPDTTNGRWMWKYENYIHMTLNGRHFRLQPAPYYQMEAIGPERFADNDSPVKGYVTAGVGTPYAAYAALYNPDTGASFLLKFGAWTRNDDGDPHRLEVWHGSLSGVADASATMSPLSGSVTFTDDFPSKRITTMAVSTIGAPSGHQRLYMACSDGSLSWIILPCTPNPKNCTSYAYRSVYGAIYLPRWNGGFPRDEKIVKAISINGVFSASHALANYVDAYSFVSDATDFDEVLFAVSATGLRTNLGFATTSLQFGLLFDAQRSTRTPQLHAAAIHYAINPPIQLVCDVSILCENGGLLKRDGSIMRIGADQIRTNIKNAIGTTAGVTVIFADEQTYAMEVKHYRETQRWDQHTKQWRSVLVVRLVQSDVDQTTATSVPGRLGFA